MKLYYCTGTITFTDNSDDKPFKGQEVFELIIQHTNKRKAKIQAVKEARNKFDREFNIGFDNIKVIVDEFYQTDELAML